MLKMSYTLSNGQVITHETDEFRSIEEARDVCARMIGGTHSVVTLNGPGGARVINTEHIMHVSIALASR